MPQKSAMPETIYVRQFITANKIKRLTAYFKKPVRNQWPRELYIRADHAAKYVMDQITERSKIEKPDPLHGEEWRRMNSNDAIL